MADVIVNGILALLAVAFAACVTKDQRGEAVFASLVLFLVWLLYVMSWTPYSLSRGLNLLFGTKLHPEDVWIGIDALAASVIIVACCTRWWAWALWASLVLEVLAHIVRQNGPVSFEPYSHLLDHVFLAQVAVFLLIGGRGVGDFLGSCTRRWGLSRGAPRSASARAAQGGKGSG